MAKHKHLTCGVSHCEDNCNGHCSYLKHYHTSHCIMWEEWAIKESKKWCPTLPKKRNCISGVTF